MLMAESVTCSPLTAAEATDEWCRLLDHSPFKTAFQHPAWHEVWWKHFGEGRSPLLLGVHEGGRLVALAPLMRDGEGLQFACDPEITDYMDVLVDTEAGDSAYTALLDALAGEPWHTLTLWGLPAGCRTITTLSQLAADRGWTVEDDYENVCPRVPLPATWDEYLASLSKKDRHELRRKMRRFQEAGAGMAVTTLSTPEEVAAGLDDFIRLHTASRHDKREFMTPAMEAFFREMAVRLAEAGLTRLFFVELNGARVAGLLAFDTGEELHLYNSGYDPEFSHASVGLVSKALTLQAALESGKRCFDFLRGAEPYKYDMGGQELQVRTLTVRRHAFA